MTITIDGTDNGTDKDVSPYIAEIPMEWVGVLGRWRYQANTTQNLDGRRVTVQSAHGGAYTREIF